MRKFLIAGLAVTPVLLFGFSSGPPQGRTGAQVDGGITCNACHRGADVNDGVGRLTITAASYSPGVKQTIRVQLTHPSARRWGFQLTARVASDPSKKAGTLSTSSEVQVRCGLTGTQVAPCGEALEFAEHTVAGTSADTANGKTWEIEWTPPDSNVGDVIFYAAGNAANNSGTNAGDFIYNTSATINPSAGGGPRPAITAGGIRDAFNYTSNIASHSWVAIVGTNLSAVERTWDDAIQGNNLPLALAGVSVKINNKAAPVYYVSPTQVNVLAPVDDAVGDVQVVVSNINGDSAPLTIRRAAAAPAFFAPFAQAGRFFVTAVALDGTILGKVGVDSRARRAARPGETIQVFGSGFGATNPVAPAEQLVTGSPALAAKPTIRIGDATADFPGNGNLISSGVYQFNVTIPASLGDGDHAIVATAGGATSANTVFISVAR
ncbi:MAG: hypothetical protein JST93_16335 [Acidobacteria bacterium]|nr:hypothetical protein [Acidobacteriota bacterium]